MTTARIFISCGEKSGENYGALLIKELRLMIDDLQIYAIGGPAMAKAGAELIHNSQDVPAMGIFEVLNSVWRLKQWQNNIYNLLKQQPFQAVILIDFGGFNIPLAARLRELKIPVFYYLPPKIWAWGFNRKQKIISNTDLILTSFPFETEIYRNQLNKVEFVGHPILDLLAEFQSTESAVKPDSKKIVGIFPGSRISEINNNLSELIKAAEQIKNSLSEEVEFQLFLADSIPEDLIVDSFNKSNLSQFLSQFSIIKNDHYQHMNRLSLALAVSGTVTLELALFKIPMIIIYRLAWSTYQIARFIVKTRYIGLPNIIAKQQLVPELIQNEACFQNISRTAVNLLTASKQLQLLSDNLKIITTKLGDIGATRRAAESIVNFCQPGAV